MTYRGMSYSRGGYKRSEGSSWRGSSSRGGFSRSESGGSRHYDSAPYDSGRSSRSFFQGQDRYQSSRPREESYHRESYRSPQDTEYSREYARGSPEPPRKRARTESSYSMASSRRSDERRYSSTGNSYGSRNHYLSEKPISGGYPMDKPTSFRDSRESRPNEHSYRKTGVSLPRSRVSLRGRSFAPGNRNRGRGFSRPSAISSRRRAGEARHPYLPSKSADYLRRLKSYRLKRSLKRRRESDAEDDDDVADLEDLDLDDKDSDDMDKNEEDADLQNSGAESEGKEGEDKDEEKTDATGDKKPKKSEPKESDSKKTSPKKSPAKAKKPASEDLETAERPDDDSVQSFITLRCPQCKYSCSTFKEYRSHLNTGRHLKSMKLVAGVIRTKLCKMRSDQRLQQRMLDNEVQGMKHLRTFFCGVCKLNYRTLKSDHQATPAHMKMQDFLQPFCKICKFTFRSPMLYESHVCDLHHIKKKAKIERLRALKKEDEEEIGNIDPNSFMVLDAVGSGDDSDASEVKESPPQKVAKVVKPKEVKKEVKKTPESRGTEFCKLIEVYYCEICRKYLPRLDDKSQALSTHCRSTMHLIRYSQEMKLQRKRAHLGKKAKKENPVEKAPPKEEPKEDPGTPKVAKENDKPDTEGSDKKWLMVENDLDELLQVNSDEEANSPESDRCGRFKHGEEEAEEKTEPTDQSPAAESTRPEESSTPEGVKNEEA